MKLTITNYQTKEELDKFKTDHWLEAVQYVEQNKTTYLSKDCKRVLIHDKDSDACCLWELLPEPRPMILRDKVFAGDMKKSSRKKAIY